MSFCRHAYRHVHSPSSSALTSDHYHVWISEDFLTATCQRFADGRRQQRRYESRVPGPLEARRRLAKRRNTALASVAGPGPGDFGCLFGKNGREHMKWTEPRGQVVELAERGMGPLNGSFESYDKSNAMQGLVGGIDTLREYLLRCRTVTDIKMILDELNINLQHEPSYSRKIMDHLFLSANETNGDAVLYVFLQDPTLNIPGAGNYGAAVEYFACHGIRAKTRHDCFRAIAQALEIGLIPLDELRDILKTLPRLYDPTTPDSTSDLKFVRKCYRQMWDAVGRCDVLGHKELDAETADAWLGILGQKCPLEDLELAKEIILTTRKPDSNCSWVPRLIMQWLKLNVRSNMETSGEFLVGLLNHFNVDVAADYAIQVTEEISLLLKRGKYRTLLLQQWSHRLQGLPHVRFLLASPVWYHVDPQEANNAGLDEADKFPLEYRIILRLWAIRSLGGSQHMWRRSRRELYINTTKLFEQYESLPLGEDFLNSFTRDLHDLNLPPNGLLMLAVNKRIRKNLTKGSRKALTRLECGPVSWLDLFTDLDAYHSSKSLFYNKFESIIKQIDVTSPAFIEHGLQVAKTGDSKTVWTLIRILRGHNPLKIAIAMSWHAPPGVSSTMQSADVEGFSSIQEVPEHAISYSEEELLNPGPYTPTAANYSYNPLIHNSSLAPSTIAPAFQTKDHLTSALPTTPTPTSNRYPYPPKPAKTTSSPNPDPHAALEMIHLLAIALSTSTNYSPRRAFHLVHTLYAFLHTHNAPIKPSLVRAMYYAGVVRYHRQGRFVNPTRYRYILGLVRRYEEPGLARSVLRGPEFGDSRGEKEIEVDFWRRGKD